MLEPLVARTDYRLKLDILTENVKIQFANFVEIATKTAGVNETTLAKAMKLHRELNAVLETIGLQVDFHEQENNQRLDSGA